MRAFTDITFDHAPAGTRAWGPWLVVAMIDTGQRMTSCDLSLAEAVTTAEEMRCSLRATVVSLINLGTGQAYVRAGVMLWAGRSLMGMDVFDRERIERTLIAEACR